MTIIYDDFLCREHCDCLTVFDFFEWWLILAVECFHFGHMQIQRSFRNPPSFDDVFGSRWAYENYEYHNALQCNQNVKECKRRWRRGRCRIKRNNFENRAQCHHCVQERCALCTIWKPETGENDEKSAIEFDANQKHRNLPAQNVLIEYVVDVRLLCDRQHRTQMAYRWSFVRQWLRFIHAQSIVGIAQ